MDRRLKHLPYKGQFNQEYFDRLHFLNKEFLRLFWANNKYLRIVNKKSKLQQIRELRVLGFFTSRNTIQLAEAGEYSCFSITYLMGFADYWNLSLSDMLYKDFSKI